MNGNLTWIGLGLLAAVSAAGVALFGKLAMTRGDVVSATFVRSLIMSAVLLGAVVWRGQPFAPVTDGSAWSWLWITLAGVCGAVSWLAYFAALRWGPASGVAVVDRSSVVFAVLLAVLFLGERPGPLAWGGLLLIVLGMVLFVCAPQATVRP